MENLTEHTTNFTAHSHLTRQLDLIPMAKLSMPVTLIGCGAIGSFTALSLVKMGITRLTVYDFDEVSVENMSNQFFRFKDIGTNKATALRALVDDFTGVKITAHAEKFTDAHVPRLQGIVIVAVDSMEARALISDAIKASGFNVKLVIDPRMGAEHYTQYTMNLFDDKDAATYAKTLYSDSEAVAERCTAKSTVYTATLAAGMIVKTIKNYIMGEPYPRTTQWAIKASDNPMVMYSGNKDIATRWDGCQSSSPTTIEQY